MSRYLSWTEFYKAIKSGDVATVKRGLFILGPRVYTTRLSEHDTALIVAAANGQVKIAEILLKSAISSPHFGGIYDIIKSATDAAVRGGHLAAVQLLLRTEHGKHQTTNPCQMRRLVIEAILHDQFSMVEHFIRKYHAVSWYDYQVTDAIFQSGFNIKVLADDVASVFEECISALRMKWGFLFDRDRLDEHIMHDSNWRRSVFVESDG